MTVPHAVTSLVNKGKANVYLPIAYAQSPELASILAVEKPSEPQQPHAASRPRSTVPRTVGSGGAQGKRERDAIDADRPHKRRYGGGHRDSSPFDSPSGADGSGASATFGGKSNQKLVYSARNASYAKPRNQHNFGADGSEINADHRPQSSTPEKRGDFGADGLMGGGPGTPSPHTVDKFKRQPPKQTPGRGGSKKQLKPRWHTQMYIMFLALRQMPGHEASRSEIIRAAVELDKQISEERGLPRVFTGKTPMNSASACLTNNGDKYFIPFKPPGARSMHFRLSYIPCDFDEAVKEYNRWNEVLANKDWPICFGQGGPGAIPSASADNTTTTATINSGVVPPKSNAHVDVVPASGPPPADAAPQGSASEVSSASADLIDVPGAPSGGEHAPSDSGAAALVETKPEVPPTDAVQPALDTVEASSESIAQPQTNGTEQTDPILNGDTPAEAQPETIAAEITPDQSIYPMQTDDSPGATTDSVPPPSQPPTTSAEAPPSVASEPTTNAPTDSTAAPATLSQANPIDGPPAKSLAAVHISDDQPLVAATQPESTEAPSTDAPAPTEAEPANPADPATETTPVDSNIPRTWHDLVEVRTSTIPGAGRGLFAVRDIPTYTPLGFYFGVPMTEDEFDSLKDHVGQASHYSIMYRRTVLDATDKDGQPFTDPDGPLYCPFHFMNERLGHGNVAFLEGFVVNQVICMTTKKIKAGSEIFVYYGSEVDREHWNTMVPDVK